MRKPAEGKQFFAPKGDYLLYNGTCIANSSEKAVHGQPVPPRKSSYGNE